MKDGIRTESSTVQTFLSAPPPADTPKLKCGQNIHPGNDLKPSRADSAQPRT